MPELRTYLKTEILSYMIGKDSGQCLAKDMQIIYLACFESVLQVICLIECWLTY